MDIILLEKIDNVGSVGDKVSVKPGYARNYLIPQGKATLATPDNIAKFKAMRVELEVRAMGEMEKAQARAAKIKDQVVKIQANAGPEGKLFGSVGTIAIAEACKALGLGIERSEVRLPDGPIRTAGEHKIELHLHTDVNVSLTVIVEGELTGVPIDLLEDDEKDETEAGDVDAQPQEKETDEEQKPAE
jgi:large subunit ribosomal protein L9